MSSKKQQISNGDSPNAKETKPRGAVDMYAAQCTKCLKWREIPTREEYEELRATITENPFTCDRRSEVSCDDPADLECDATRTWVIDKPNLPMTPEGFKRELILRSDYSKLDAHYVTPTGKKVRCRTEVIQYLDKHPEIKANLDDFNFNVPKIMEETIPIEAKKRLAEKSGSKKEDSAVTKKKN